MIGYNVYINGVKHNTEPVLESTYTFDADPGVDYECYVTVVYDDGTESSPSNVVVDSVGVITIPNISSMRFNGSSDYIDLGTPILSDDTTQPFSFGAIINSDNISSHGVIIDQSYESGIFNGIQLLQGDSGDLRVVIRDASGNTIRREGHSIEEGTFYTVFGTYDGSQTAEGVKLYVNSVEIEYTTSSGTLSGNYGISTLNTGIGSRELGGRNFFAGLIDEIQIWNKALAQSEVAYYSNRILQGTEEGLVGYWNFEDRDTNQVTDLTANANHGTIVGSPTYEYNAFNFNYALEFDGVDDYVEIGEVNSGLPLQTMMFKVYLEDGITTSNIQSILEGNYASDYNYILIGQGSTQTTDATLSLGSRSGSSFPRTYIKDVFPAGWHHICIRWDDTNSRFDIFVNGISRTLYSGSFGHVSSTNMALLNLYLGASTPYDNGKFIIDDLAVFNYSLTEEEIQLNMNKELTGDESGLVGLWKFDDLSDPTVAIDSSPNANDGVIHG